MSSTLYTTTKIIEALGGAEAVGRLLNSNAKAIWNWRAHNKFPAHTYVVLRDALAAKQLKAPDHLWAMTRPARKVRSDRRSAM